MRKTKSKTITGYKLLDCEYGLVDVIQLRATIDSESIEPIADMKTREISDEKFYGKKSFVTKIETLDGREVPDSFFEDFVCTTHVFGIEREEFRPQTKVKNVFMYFYNKDVSDKEDVLTYDPFKRKIYSSVEDLQVLETQNIDIVWKKHKKLTFKYACLFGDYKNAHNKLQGFDICNQKINHIINKNQEKDKWIFHRVKQYCYDEYYKQLSDLNVYEKELTDILNVRIKLGDYLRSNKEKSID